MTGNSKRRASLEDLPPPPDETLSEKFTYWQYRSVWELAARLPDRMARRLPDRLGTMWYLGASERQRRMVRINLRRVAGHPADDDLEELVEAAYRSYAKYWFDAFRLHTMSPHEVVARSVGENLEAVDELLAGGQGAILATAHLGSWDIGAMFATERDWDVTVVAEVVEPRRLFDRFVWLRRKAGLGVIPLVKGGDMITRLTSVVEDGGLAALLADRDLTKKGPVVEFFGEPCRLPPGTAVLARRTGRPVAVGAFVTEGDGYRGVITDVVDISQLTVEQGTQVVAHALEELIGRYPAQWHVFVPQWLAERESDHPALAEDFAAPQIDIADVRYEPGS
ncbi:MAG: phosphatidylinositol mannoside acyltransferase [Nitriliruptorales bacterium]|nr:phosphatidylinositol mannoside acyltransferase [Nitriliruptorales bacterium]